MFKVTGAEYCFNLCYFIAQVNQMDDVFSIQDPHFWALSRFVLHIHVFFSYVEEDTLFMCLLMVWLLTRSLLGTQYVYITVKREIQNTCVYNINYL